MPGIEGDKLRGHLEGLILSVLERGEAHGLEIVRRLDSAGDGMLRLKEGSLYPALYRLENAGLVKAEWEAQTKGRRGARRRIYQLTAKGVRELGRSRTHWREFSRVIGAIMGVPT